MDLRHLRYVVVLADELNFTNAAEALNMSQPPLSRHIRLIEQELGFKLFNRDKHSVRLTEAGEKFVSKARAVLFRFEHVTNVVARTHRGEIGRLVVGAVTTQKRMLVECVRAFSKNFPEVRLEFQSLGSDDLAKAVAEGTIHVALLIMPVNQPDLIVEKVASEPRLLALPKDHPLASKKRIPLSSLKNQDFILFTRPLCSGAYDYIVRTCANAGINLEIAYEVNNVMTGLSLVEAGLGIALFPASIQDFKPRRIVFRPVDPPFPTADYCLSYNPENESSIVRSFVALARSTFAGPRLSPAPRRRDDSREERLGS